MITAEHIVESIKNGIDGKSNLTPEQLSVRGFSTATQRHIFSNLCDINGTYLEIGLFCGATFVSSFNKNLTSIGVENHSQDFGEGFDLVKQELSDNVKKFADNAKGVYLHYTDCFSMDKSVLPDDIDIFYYDGEHSELNQSKALPYFIDKMAKTFVMIVDDYSWKAVEGGTLAGLEKLKESIDVEHCWILKGQQQNDDPIFHNGIAIFLINKK